MLLLRLLTLGCQYSVADVVATSVDSMLLSYSVADVVATSVDSGLPVLSS